MDDIVIIFLFPSLILLPIFLLINFIVAAKFNEIAMLKGYSNDDEKHCFAMCFFLGIIGYLYVIALPMKPSHVGQEKIVPTNTIKAPINSRYKCDNIFV